MAPFNNHLSEFLSPKGAGHDFANLLGDALAPSFNVGEQYETHFSRQDRELNLCSYLRDWMIITQRL